MRRVGAVVERPVDVKLIAATQADLSELVRVEQFRPDLYHWLAVIVLELPPLRARGDDILILAQFFLQQYAVAHKVPPKRLSAAAEAWRLHTRWTGNVRELSHLMERVTLLHAAALIDPKALERLHLPQPDSSSHVEKVQGFGGSVVQRSPSLIIVAFGPPQTLEQLPQRAVQAALAIRQLVVEAEARAGLEPCPMVREAVHWGSLLVEAQAYNPATRLLPVSDTLAQPVRLLGHAAPGDILVSPEVGRLVGEWYGLRAREGGTGAGDVDQAMAYSVIGLSPRRSPLERYGQRPLSRFVGREQELAILQVLLGHVEAGQGQVVGLMGEPGVGKTRLLYEFIRTHRSHGWLVLESHADSYGQATPYLPVIDLLKAYFQVEGHDAVQSVREKVTSRLLTLDPALQATLPALFALLEVPVEEPLWQTLDPHQRRQKTLDALKDLWLGESVVRAKASSMRQRRRYNSQT